MEHTQAPSSLLENAPFIPPDSIFELGKNYSADPHPKKVLVGGGTYRDGEGKPWILPSVRLAEQSIENSGHEYLPISGLKPFRDRAVDLVFHGTQALKGGRVCDILPEGRQVTAGLFRMPLASHCQEQVHFS